MIHIEAYPMEGESIINALERLADTCINRKTHPKNTFIGSISQNLPINLEYICKNGVNENTMMVEDLLKGAENFLLEGRLRIVTRFTLRNQLRLFLPVYKQWEIIIAHKKVDPSDDLKWYLSVCYNEYTTDPIDSLIVAIRTNGVNQIPEDDNFKVIYKILFGNTMSSYQSPLL